MFVVPEIFLKYSVKTSNNSLIGIILQFYKSRPLKLNNLIWRAETVIIVQGKQLSYNRETSDLHSQETEMLFGGGGATTSLGKEHSLAFFLDNRWASLRRQTSVCKLIFSLTVQLTFCKHKNQIWRIHGLWIHLMMLRPGYKEAVSNK